MSIQLSTDDYEKIVHVWNNTQKKYPVEKTLQQLFEEQVVLIPTQLAVVSEEEFLTYYEVNILANQLANYLVDIGVAPGVLVIIVLERSPRMIIALLAVLKAGATYVPLDSNYPIDHIQSIFEDTQAPVIIVDIDTIDKIPATFAHVLCLDDEWSKITKFCSKNPIIQLSSNQLAYVIYTSGTTGTSKGVMIEHASVVNYIFNVKDYSLISPGDIVDFSTNIGFDLSVTTTLSALCLGAQIVVYRHSLQDIVTYQQHLINHNIRVIKLVPSYFELLIDILPLTKINKIILGGEKLSTNIINKLKALPNNTEIKIYDEYGPTEATVGACIIEVRLDKPLTIGKPYYNYRVYVLDEKLKPIPPGDLGELYISGMGLAKGYLNQAQLTAERFIFNPFQTQEDQHLNIHSRIYKTGDLVRWLDDGNLEYIGRNDFQVKINGNRIELEQIESILSSYPGINQSIVMAFEKEGIKENKYLVAYYLSKNKIDEKDIIFFLKKKLPTYMVPTTLIAMENFPLTLNGKIDRKALPLPRLNLSEYFLAPRNELEKKLCRLWAKIIDLDPSSISIDEDFLRLGGSSLLIVKFINEINQELHIPISVFEIFENNTIEKLASYLENPVKEEIIIEKISAIGPEQQYLSFAQERLWFIEKYEQGTCAYNVPMVFELSREADTRLLEQSIRAIVSRHEILRTLIKEDAEGHGYQRVMAGQKDLLEIHHLTVSNELHLQDSLKKEINAVFHLNTEYPIRVFFYELGENQARYLNIVVHHIAFDGWSIDLFLKELQVFYYHYLDESRGIKSALTLPELSIQYKDFALWQRNYLQGERLQQQLDYWKNHLNGFEPLQLMTDKPRPARVDYHGEDILLF